MRYSNRTLVQLFVDWPAVVVSNDLRMVESRVDVINAVSKKEGITYEQAQAGLMRAWETVNRMGGLALTAAAAEFAKQVGGTINGRR